MKPKNLLTTRLAVFLVILFVLFSIQSSVSAGSFAGLGQWKNIFTRPADLSNQQGLNSPHYARIPAVFVPNQGQISDKGVKFQMSNHGEGAFFGPGAFDLSMQDQPAQRDLQTGKAMASQAPFQARVHYPGANLKAEVVGINPLPGKANYLHGRNTSDWVTEVSTFAGIVYKDFYSGIDLTITGDAGHLKSSFILSPGVDPAIIQWHYPGASAITLDPHKVICRFSGRAARKPGCFLRWRRLPGKSGMGRKSRYRCNTS